MRGWLVVAATGGILAACSLGGLDGFSGGTTDAPDGGGDATLADVVATGDTGTSNDSGAGDSGAKRFCETLTQTPRVCVDFEDGALPLGFNKNERESTVVVNGQGKDGTKGLTISIPATSSSDAQACITIALPGPRSSLIVEADVRVSEAGIGNYEIINLYNGNDRELGVSVTGTTMRIEEERPIDGGIELTTNATLPIKSTYQRLRFVATIDGQVAHTELFVDGVSAAKHDASAANAGATTDVQIGDCLLVGAKGWTAHYDNVVVYETN